MKKRPTINPNDAQKALEDIENGTNKGGANTVKTIKNCVKKFTKEGNSNKSLCKKCPDCGYISSPVSRHCSKCGKLL